MRERNSYVVIKKDGVMRQWLQFFDLVDYLPLELTPISNKAFKEIDSPINLQKGVDVITYFPEFTL
ncbi:hypothetical protein NWP96_07875 [Mycoplasmopsis cynos]|nr:hypothetical protein [Mycoplasmopsis cynos]